MESWVLLKGDLSDRSQRVKVGEAFPRIRKSCFTLSASKTDLGESYLLAIFPPFF